MKRITLLVSLAACVDEPELGTESQSLVAGNLIVQRGPECTTWDLSDANLNRFRNTMLYDLMPRARTVANSPAFKSCVRDAVTVGKTLPNVTVGPMVSAVNEAGQVATAGLPVDRMRDIYASRMALEAVSPHQMIMNCTLLPNVGGWADGPPANGDFATREEIQIHANVMNRDPTDFPGNGGFRAWLAAVVWHEAMHERNYWHAEATYMQHAINIVGACMEATYEGSARICGLTPCANGFNALYTFDVGQNADPGGCACVRDPGASFTPTRIGSWTIKGLADTGLDASGQAYILVNGPGGGAVQKLVGQSWTHVAAADAMIAGGDAVAVRQPSPVIYDPPRWWTIPHVGPWTAASSVAGEVVQLDNFGRLVRLANGVLERKRGAESFVKHGDATAFATGSDKLFKISAGTAYRLDEGALSWTKLGGIDGSITADIYGTLYNRASNQSLWRHRGTYWESLGGPVDQIGADGSLFIRTPGTNYVWRFAPDNNWYAVGQCDSFKTGGRNVLCRRGTRLELYEY